jgi:hypothetical protein
MSADVKALVAALRDGGGDADAQATRTFALTCALRVAPDEQAAVAVAAAAGAVEASVAALRRWPAHMRAQHKGCELLALLCDNNEACVSRGAACGACGALLAALRAFGESENGVYACAVSSLNSLHVSDGSAERYADDVLNILITGLRAHAGTAVVSQYACLFLGNLVLRDGALAARLTTAGTPAAVAHALRANAEDAALQCFGVCTLQKLCMAHLQACMELLPSGAAAAAVVACRTHAANARVTKECCKLLVMVRTADVTQLAAIGMFEVMSATLAAQPADGTLLQCCSLAMEVACAKCAPNRAPAVCAGALPALVAAMAAQAASLQCVEHASTALAAVCLAPDAKTVQAATAAGVQVAAATALRRHGVASAKVSSSCCSMLASMCTTLQPRQHVVAAGGFEAAVAALTAHPSNIGLQIYGTNAVGNMGSGDVALKERGGAAGASEAIVAVLSRCTERTPVMVQLAQVATCALSNLTREPELEANRSRAFAAGAVPALIAALDMHVADASVARFCASALNCIISDSDKRRRATGAAGAVALVAVMRAHPAQVPLQKDACGALAAVCRDVEAHAAAAAAAGALPLMVAVLAAHPREAELHHEACTALGIVCAHDASRRTAAGAAGVVEAIAAYLMDVPANTARAAAAGAVAATTEAMRAHPTNGNILLSGCTMLLGLIKAHAPSLDAAVAAGAIEAATSSLLAASVVCLPACSMLHIPGVRLLLQLVQGSEERCARAVRAGALQLRDDAPAENQTQTLAAALRQTLHDTLRDAAEQHDASDRAACTAAGSCRRCDEWRADGRLCALRGCGARRRADADGDDTGRRGLLRCSACRVVAYCSIEHQREDWRAGHKTACASLRAPRAPRDGADAADDDA